MSPTVPDPVYRRILEFDLQQEEGILQILVCRILLFKRPLGSQFRALEGLENSKEDPEESLIAYGFGVPRYEGPLGLDLDHHS